MIEVGYSRRSPQSVYLNRFLAGNERLYLGGNFGDGGNNWGVSSVSDGNIGQFFKAKTSAETTGMVQAEAAKVMEKLKANVLEAKGG